MKMHLLTASIGWVLIGSAAAQPAAPPAERPTPPVEQPLASTNTVAYELEPPREERLNRVGLAYRMGLNIKVDFKKLGGFPAISDPGPALGITNRSYDNGSYNFVDISTNAGGLTWYWGYQDPGQLQGGGLVMESVSSPNNVTSKNRQDDPQHGFEAFYSRELYRKEKWRMGAELGLGYVAIDVEDSKTLRGQVNRLIDTYEIPPGVILPAAPYQGTFEGPGALIGALPQRQTTVISREALITGRREVQSDVYMLRLGPYFEFPYKRLSLLLGGGLTLAIGDTDFSYEETVTIEGSGSITRTSSGSQTDFLVGGYVAGTIAYAINDEWRAFGGVQFQMAGESVTDTRTRNGAPESKKQSVLDLGESLMFVFGASYSF